MLSQVTNAESRKLPSRPPHQRESMIVIMNQASTPTWTRIVASETVCDRTQYGKSKCTRPCLRVSRRCPARIHPGPHQYWIGFGSRGDCKPSLAGDAMDRPDRSPGLATG